MLRKIAGAVLILSVSVGLAMAEDFNLRIKKVEGDKISGTKGGKFNQETKKFEGGEEVTLTAASNIKVVKGQFNKDTKKIDAGDAIEDGLKNKMFTEIPKFGLFTQATTGDDGKITEIRVTAFKKKKDAE